MNKFYGTATETLNNMREYIANEPELRGLVSELNSIDASFNDKDENKMRLRLPYSSNPVSTTQKWK